MRRFLWVLNFSFLFSFLLGGCAEQWSLVAKLKEQQLNVTENERGIIVTLPYVYFAFGSADLNPEARKVVDTIAKILTDARAGERNVAIEGHSDSVGKPEANITLSQQRAETVAQELIAGGMKKERLTTHGYGEERPVEPNTNPDGSDNPEGRAHNRRVEIIIERRPEDKRTSRVFAPTAEPDGWTPLMLAAIRNQRPEVETLLAAGADPLAQNTQGGTALMMAVNNGAVDIARLLLAKGADVNAKNRSGWTALMYAAWRGQGDLVALLLNHGADATVKDAQGWTALMYGTWNGQTDAVRSLLENGASRTLSGQEKEAAARLARERDYPAIAQLFAQPWPQG